jgi:NAD(P)-dependent dehydrogenase (short-subunit alcohol dehydrogenase family)
MRDLRGKAAFVTGAASGIGFALARVFAVADMRVMLADIETDALALAVEKLQGLGLGVRGVICDVPIRRASSARRRRHSRRSGTFTWSATTLGWQAEASVTQG